MKKLLAAALVAAGLGSIGSVTAQAPAYPSRPITMIVSYPPGGPTDSLARIIVDRLRVSLGQPVIIENVSGAAGTIGLARTARAAPDGYTINIGQWADHVSAPAIYPVAFDVLKDFEPISLLTNARLWMLSKKDLPANNVHELIAWLKANPDKATVGTVGSGSAAHVCEIYFQNKTGTRFQFVPYRGTGPALQDLLGGTIDLLCAEASNTLPQVQAGRFKAFAVMSETRWPLAPDVPTMEEAGVPGLTISFWHGLWAPKGTPKDIVAKLNTAVVDTLTDPAIRQRLITIGQDIPPRDQLTSEALSAFHKAEIEKWWPIIKAAGIKPE